METTIKIMFAKQEFAFDIQFEDTSRVGNDLINDIENYLVYLIKCCTIINLKDPRFSRNFAINQIIDGSFKNILMSLVYTGSLSGVHRRTIESIISELK